MTAGDNHGGNNYGGDQVNIFGGEGHTGIVHHHAGPQQQPTLEEALRTVVELMRVLRAEVPPEDRGSFDDALPVLAADEDATPPPVRRRALLTVAGIAALLGTVGTPLLDAARAALELLGVGG
ncbi:hypothetical protein [Streptomyces gardneri]|uniref:Uncharacterized protein n=1 Tax=Streptomyces gardneri TaxID=66892 RepID=A0A4Y3RN07_9ACTN|nr:hypothetical protein [Streptomyces gardneri]GEB58749.1 hypothetical protein SGA01_43540 [Streptomyces gardneri]GHH07263.1 hypothetical protein GCM10017674_48550 [Streptomyces gardneri]